MEKNCYCGGKKNNNQRSFKDVQVCKKRWKNYVTQFITESSDIFAIMLTKGQSFNQFLIWNLKSIALAIQM